MHSIKQSLAFTCTIVYKSLASTRLAPTPQSIYISWPWHRWASSWSCTSARRATRQASNAIFLLPSLGDGVAISVSSSDIIYFFRDDRGRYVVCGGRHTYVGQGLVRPITWVHKENKIALSLSTCSVIWSTSTYPFPLSCCPNIYTC